MISVIIPAYNAEKTITSTIKALLNQNYPKNKYEIIVVDDGSTDKTVEVVSRFPVKTIKLKHKGPANARNVGAKKSRGSILLFTDADCVPDKNWIKNMIEPFKDPEIVGLSGTYKTLNSDKLMARFSGYEIQHRHKKMEKQKYIDFIGTFSASYRRNIFLKFKGFDTKFKTSSGEDPELSYRIAKAGFKMIFQKKAFVWHLHPDTIWKYLKQKYYRAVWRNFMYWGEHKKKIISSDSYTGKMLLPQIFLSGILPLLIVSLIFLNYLELFSIISIPILILLIATLFNLDFIIFLYKKEKKIALLSPFILSIRNIVVVFGILNGMIKILTI
jgi:glycosyltransferase involved in cell wall biosynthesis